MSAAAATEGDGLATDDAITRVVAAGHPVALRLIDATIAVIDERGESAVRVQDVVEQAGVQVPVLYRHFGNREGLVQAAQLARLFRDLDAEMAVVERAIRSADGADELRATFDRLLLRVMEPERRQLRWRRVGILGSTWGRPELTAAISVALRSSMSRLADALRGPAEQGWLREDFDPVAFSDWFAGAALSRFAAEVHPGPVDESFDRMWCDAVRFVLFG